VLGITTTLPFFARVLRHPEFVAGDIDTGFVARMMAEPCEPAAEAVEIAVMAAAIRALQDRQSTRVQAPASGGVSAWRATAWRDLGTP
jgi:acetyl/propionyl-CoA carboxylase alpha subunit